MFRNTFRSLRVLSISQRKVGTHLGNFQGSHLKQRILSRDSFKSCSLSIVGRHSLWTSSFLCNKVTVPTPGFPESISEGDIIWHKAVGDTVAEDEVIGEIETDKTSLPVHSPVNGVIETLHVSDGDKVSKGVDLAVVIAGDATSAPPKAPTPSPAAAPQEAPPVVATSSTTVSSPAFANVAPPLPTAPLTSTPVGNIQPRRAEVVSTDAVGNRSEHRVKMNRMRQRIAQRLKDAQNTCAMLTTFNEIDMSNIIELRKSYQDQFVKKHGFKLGFMSAFVKATSQALHNQPVVNAVIDDVEILYRDYVDISVAVATPKGLVVPVLRNVENLNYAEIEAALNAMGEKARAGKLAIEEMDGGTFTISNGGVFGSMFGTPIINPPQSAILGMHGVFERPVAINGKVEIRPMMYVALTYDHRLVDGREAVVFLKDIKKAVEDPRILLLDL